MLYNDRSSSDPLTLVNFLTNFFSFLPFNHSYYNCQFQYDFTFLDNLGPSFIDSSIDPFITCCFAKVFPYSFHCCFYWEYFLDFDYNHSNHQVITYSMVIDLLQNDFYSFDSIDSISILQHPGKHYFITSVLFLYFHPHYLHTQVCNGRKYQNHIYPYHLLNLV